MGKISTNTLLRYIEGIDDLYDVLTRKKFFLPKEKSSLTTEQYLISVINGQLKFKKYNELILSPCPKAPTKYILLKKLLNYFC
jgi:hypothetical protein